MYLWIYRSLALLFIVWSTWCLSIRRCGHVVLSDKFNSPSTNTMMEEDNIIAQLGDVWSELLMSHYCFSVFFSVELSEGGSWVRRVCGSKYLKERRKFTSEFVLILLIQVRVFSGQVGVPGLYPPIYLYNCRRGNLSIYHRSGLLLYDYQISKISLHTQTESAKKQMYCNWAEEWQKKT